MRVFLGPIAGGIALALASLIAQQLGITLTDAQTGQLGEAIMLGMAYSIASVSSMAIKKKTNPQNLAVLPAVVAAAEERKIENAP